MIKADLTKKATLDAMVRLVPEHDTLEAPGREPTTPAEVFQDRKGYDPDFLDGWSIPLPLAQDHPHDMCPLRRGGYGYELTYQHFSVLMSTSRRMARLTAANIDGAESRRVPRITTWSYDGRLDPGDQWGDELYYNNALDRGHMVRREDPVWGSPAKARTANADTFHFTNSCPQMAGVNQKTWVGLENYILQHTREDSMRVSVFTGPFFSDDDLEYRGAKVPLSFWKVVAIVTETGRPSATAYVVSQEKELSELEFVFAGYKTFQVSIQEVLERSGIDFSALLDYDGFTQHERAGNNRLRERIDELEAIRI